MVLSLFISIIITFIFGFFIAKYDLKKNPNLNIDTVHKHSKSVHFIVSILVGIFVLNIVANFYDLLMQQLPLIIQRYSTYLLWLNISFITGFMSGYLLYITKETETKLNIYSTLSSLFIANLTVVILNFIAIKPIDNLLKNILTDGIVFQTTSYSSTPASIANLAKIYNQNITEKDVVKIAGTTIMGTSSGQMRYTLDKLKIKFKSLNGNFKNLFEVTPPAIIFVNHKVAGREGHSVVYLGKKDNFYEIIDPLEGKVFWNEEFIKQNWKGNGVMCFE